MVLNFAKPDGSTWYKYYALYIRISNRSEIEVKFSFFAERGQAHGNIVLIVQGNTEFKNISTAFL